MPSGHDDRLPVVPAQATAADRQPDPAPPAEPAPKRVLAQPPPTHGRGVRMTIYGIGGAIAIGLIVVIIAMAGGTIIPPGESEEDPEAPRPSLIDSDGAIDPDVYAQLAADVGSDAWINWRYGAPSGSDGGDAIDQPKATEIDFDDKLDHLAQYGDDSALTTPKNVQGQFAFVESSGPGVGHVTTVETTDSSIGFTPRPGGRFSADAAEPELTDGSTAKCLKGADLGRVVALDRADDSARAAHAVVAFSTGAIATTGISGAQGGTCVQLPKGQVPTAVTITPANEFAFVTVWDTAELRGRLAVIALGDKAGTYASSWPSPQPGLPNPGHFGFAKLLGFVDLPDLAAPTAVATSTNYSNGFVDRRTADLSTEQGRAPFADDLATSGFVVVASQAEKKLQWIDLSKMLDVIGKTYFSGEPAAYASPGKKDEAWPPTFGVNADFAPVVTGVADVDAEPTAVAAIGETAHVATTSGALLRFDVADPAAPKQDGTTDLPGAATCLSATTDNSGLIATSREDRSVTWVKPDDGKVTQTLRDSRLVDPVCAQDSPDTVDSDGGGTSVRTVTVADYTGETLHTYRYGPGKLADGTKVDLAAGAFEYGGGLKAPGKPFAVSTALDQS
ncbi:hypothetical protein [Stackebrandtia soli]|uniref:hypothetical protein n=1 Tax=Stackebrandtia soli TaxID=1892856 RepID=UPI0039EA9FC5